MDFLVFLTFYVMGTLIILLSMDILSINQAFEVDVFEHPRFYDKFSHLKKDVSMASASLY